MFPRLSCNGSEIHLGALLEMGRRSSDEQKSAILDRRGSKWSFRSVGEEKRKLRLGKHVAGHSAKDYFQHPGMGVAPHHHKIGSRYRGMGAEGFGYTALLHWKIGNQHFLAMPGEMGRKTPGRNAFQSAVRNTNDVNLFSANKQRYRIARGPGGSAAAVPGDNDFLEPRAPRPIRRHDHNRPAGRKQHRFNHGPVQGEIRPRPGQDRDIAWPG